MQQRNDFKEELFKDMFPIEEELAYHKELLEPIIWDIGDEEEEYPFVNKYPGFQEEPFVLVEEESCLVYDTDNEEEEESMPIYDTDINDVIEEEKGFVGKEGFGKEEDNLEDVVVLANDLYSSMIQTILSIDFKEDINTKSHELMPFEKSIINKVSQSSFKFLICKKYQEWYLKAPPMVDKLGFKIDLGKRLSRYKEREFDAGDTNLDATSTRDV
uniref:Uncharacterized protein n=1 Tax=Tanacetum cinerariifolium TaxID=118510 RepID=A0A699H9Z8_TANCI|nr:hypothetical protein [Tanacetum cinerariifolium]